MAEETGLLLKNITFILLNLLFFAILLFAVARVATGDALYEKFFAKQIALMIDEAKPDTNLSLDASELIYKIRKNKVSSADAVGIKDGKVIIKINKGGGYSYNYFSNNLVTYGLDVKNKELVFEIK